LIIKELKTYQSDTNERLDLFLQKQMLISRNQIRNLINSGLVSVEQKVAQKAGMKLKPKMQVQVKILEAKKDSVDVDFDVEIIYEDDDILIVNKPSGLVVHPAPSVKEPTLVDWLRSKNITLSTLNGEQRDGIVHRIDKETSGVLVVAKNNDAHQKLAKQLEDKSMGRYYLALIDLELKEDCIVEKPIGRNPKNRFKMAVVEGGKEAKTAFIKLLQANSCRYELIAAKLFSGRTHQIRVHLHSLSRHIVGDLLYGFKSNNDRIGRFYLHAYIISLKHPKDGKLRHFVAPLGDDFKRMLEKYFDMENLNEKIKPQSLIDSFCTAYEWV